MARLIFTQQRVGAEGHILLQIVAHISLHNVLVSPV